MIAICSQALFISPEPLSVPTGTTCTRFSAPGVANHGIAVYAPLYPCEPKLTYSACNLQGNFAHLVADRIFGTNARQQLVERLRPMHVSEMMCRDGVVARRTRDSLGIRIPVYTSNQVEALWGGWQAYSSPTCRNESGQRCDTNT